MTTGFYGPTGIADRPSTWTMAAAANPETYTQTASITARLKRTCFVVNIVVPPASLDKASSVFTMQMMKANKGHQYEKRVFYLYDPFTTSYYDINNDECLHLNHKSSCHSIGGVHQIAIISSPMDLRIMSRRKGQTSIHPNSTRFNRDVGRYKLTAMPKRPRRSGSVSVIRLL